MSRKLLQTLDFDVTFMSQNPAFDFACHQAYKKAVMLHKIDEDGHCPVEGWERFNSTLEVEFKGYKRIGPEQVYYFSSSLFSFLDDEPFPPDSEATDWYLN